MEKRRSAGKVHGVSARSAPKQGHGVSAKKVGGRKLYELAREGVEIERAAREVDIHRLELVDFAPSAYPEATFRVVCSSGTYVRTLADDIARALGGRAHLNALRRVRNGSLHVDQAISIEELETESSEDGGTTGFLSLRDGLPDMPEAVIDEETEAGVANGLSVPSTSLGPDIAEGPVKLVDSHGELAAVYRQIWNITGDVGSKARAHKCLSTLDTERLSLLAEINQQHQNSLAELGKLLTEQQREF